MRWIFVLAALVACKGSDEVEETDVCEPSTETCNGVDDDCDGEIDEFAGTDWFADADADGFGTGWATRACEAPDGMVPAAGDCDDERADVFPGAPTLCDTDDRDCDGAPDAEDADGDGFLACAECDDADPGVNPAATESCDGVDEDCDGEVDEDAADAPTWYVDADADGHGDPENPVDRIACEVPEGATDVDDDCDDADATVFPGADETCDLDDEDCDGLVDDDAIDATTFYEDGDADGYGLDASSIAACELPDGYAALGGDCADDDADVNPSAVERCDDVDEDCDGLVDDDAIDPTTWYADGDVDGYGDPDAAVAACDRPSGHVADASDCDDADDLVNPSITEVCDGIDQDCDGLADDADATDRSTYGADADLDGFGSSAETTLACTAPDGFLDDTSDCDDADPDVHPGAPEIYNGVDDDCAGGADDIGFTGTGADGALTVTSSLDLSATDAPAHAVTAIAGSTVTVSGTPALAPGDEVLLISMHGSDAAHDAVGTYELAWVASVSGSDVTLDAVLETYGQMSNADLSGQAIQLVRVPHYTDVTVGDGLVVTTAPWDGQTGGVLAFRATGTVTVGVGASVTVDGLGYAGGERGDTANCDAFQGESYAGTGGGQGDGACSAYNETYGHWAANYGGGGAHITGGGGNHAGGATGGDSWNGGTATAPAAGATYGVADLTSLFMGSGGGGVWYGTAGGDPGPGGDGAGVLFVAADTIDAGAGAFTATGGDTVHWAQGTWSYGAGGGAGGSIWLVADTLTLAPGAVDATGGLGERTHTRLGGNGGYGRVRLDYAVLNGQIWGSGADAIERSAVAEPDPGHTESP